VTKNWFQINNKVAIVTGAGSGVGRAIALAFAEAGVKVVLAEKNHASGKETAGQIKKQTGGEVIFIEVDVTNLDQVDNLMKKTIHGFGRVDILVNNAGVLTPRLLVDPAGKEELTEEIWDNTFGINVKGAFLCSQAVVRQMIAGKKEGVIINVSSESALEGSVGQSAYAATKAALYSLSRSWAKELGDHNIRVVGIAPGILEETGLRSPEYERALAYARGISAETLQKNYTAGAIPVGREGTLEEVANLVCFLASSRASYIHGTVVNISGGKSGR